MPTGTGAAVLSSLPEVPYTLDTAQFMAKTEKNHQPLDVVPTPGPGNTTTFTLPRSGVASTLKLKFIGNLNVGTSGPTFGPRWPYGLLDGFKLSAGLGSDLWDAAAEDVLGRGLKQPHRGRRRRNQLQRLRTSSAVG